MSTFQQKIARDSVTLLKERILQMDCGEATEFHNAAISLIDDASEQIADNERLFETVLRLIDEGRKVDNRTISLVRQAISYIATGTAHAN